MYKYLITSVCDCMRYLLCGGYMNRAQTAYYHYDLDGMCSAMYIVIPATTTDMTRKWQKQHVKK